MSAHDQAVVEGILQREPRAVARAISIVEGGGQRADALIGALGTRGHARRMGVTGPPGVGKSTLVGALVTALRARGQTVGVLAVDPTSPYSGGALLGDRLRMPSHHADPGVYIRSMATRGETGGLARATAGAATVLDAAGFDTILIETVGVGQADIDIVHAADLVMVVVAPGAGDEIQALKAGLMEIGDLFLVNKADREGADRAVGALETALRLGASPAGAWRPPVIRTVATSGDGLADVLAACDRFFEGLGSRPVSRRPAVRAGDHRERGGLDAVLDHVGVAVVNRDGLTRVLRLLGLDVGPAEDVAAAARVRFVRAGGAAVELVEALDAESPLGKFLRGRHVKEAALHHVAFRVADLDRALEILRAEHVGVIDPAPRSGAQGSRVAFLHPSSTSGVLLELVESTYAHR